MRAAADEQRRRLGEKAGVADEEVLRDLQDLGYTPETVMMLYLVPVIQTAWAEGGVSQKERDLIVKAARSRGITAGHAVRSTAEHVADDTAVGRDVREIAPRDPDDPAGAAGGRPRGRAKKICCRSPRPSPRRQAASSGSARSRTKNSRFSRTSATS